MITYNVIAVLSKDLKSVLMCKRAKDPYKGLLNLVGGKKKEGESSFDGAYRELCEETGISRNDIKLMRIMDFSYVADGFFMEVYAGILNKDVCASGDENELLWIDVNEDFFDTRRFAGDGNLGHIKRVIKRNIDLLK